MFHIGSGVQYDDRPLAEWSSKQLKQEKAAMERDRKRGFFDNEAWDELLDEIKARGIES